MTTILFILVALLVFGVLIAVHELGHFLAAKFCGVQVHEFSIGMGPAVWKRIRRRPNILCVFCPLAVIVPWRARVRNPTAPEH